MKITERQLRQIIREELLRESDISSFESQYPLSAITSNSDPSNTNALWSLFRNWTFANPDLTLARGIKEFYMYDQGRAASMERALTKIDKTLKGVIDREVAAEKAKVPRDLDTPVSKTIFWSMEDIATLRGINNAVAQVETQVGQGRFMEAMAQLLPPPRFKTLQAKIREATAEQAPALEELRIGLGIQERPPPPPPGTSRGIEYADEETVEDELRTYIKNSMSPSDATRASIQRYIRQNNSGEEAKTHFRSLFREPSDTEDPYAYRGINIPEEDLPRFGVDPSGLARGVWTLLGPDEDGTHGDMPQRLTPKPREIPIPNLLGVTVSSWSYSYLEAQRFAGHGAQGQAQIVLAADMFAAKNDCKFLEMYALYEELDLDRFSDEVELLGVASAANPIRGRVLLVRLP